MTVSDTDVELVLAALPIDPSDGTTVVGFSEGGAFPRWGSPRGVAAAIVAALSAAGRLIPEGSETREEWSVRMWMADAPDLVEEGEVVLGKPRAEARVAFHRRKLEEDPGWRGRCELIRRESITTPWSPVPEEKP